MVAETVTPGVISDGNGLILFVPTIANPAAPTVAELTAGTVKKLTYSVTGDGYSHTATPATVTATRLFLKQVLQYDTTVTDELSITYVYTNTTDDVVRIALAEGVTGFIVERFAVANDAAIAAGQLVDVIPIKAGISTKNPPATGQELTRTQALNVTGAVQRDRPIAA